MSLSSIWSKLRLIIKKDSEDEALEGLGVHLTQLTDAILVPLQGNEQADVPQELRDRIEKFLE